MTSYCYSLSANPNGQYIVCMLTYLCRSTNHIHVEIYFIHLQNKFVATDIDTYIKVHIVDYFFNFYMISVIILQNT